MNALPYTCFNGRKLSSLRMFSVAILVVFSHSERPRKVTTLFPEKPGNRVVTSRACACNVHWTLLPVPNIQGGGRAKRGRVWTTLHCDRGTNNDIAVGLLINSNSNSSGCSGLTVCMCFKTRSHPPLFTTADQRSRLANSWWVTARRRSGATPLWSGRSSLMSTLWTMEDHDEETKYR